MIAVTGVGLESPLGASLDALAHAVRSGRVAAGQRVTGFEERAHIPARRARRLSRLALLSAAAARSALTDAHLTPIPERTAVALGTGLGSLGLTVAFMRSYLAHGAGGAEPTLFPTSVLNEPAAQLAIELALRGPNFTVTQHEDSFLGALALASDLLALGRADAVLAGGCDELSPEIEHGLRRLGLVSASGVARPFDRRRDGLLPGEGAVMLVLERARDAHERGARVRARLAGLALAADPVQAARTALAEAGRAPSDLDYLALGACGSRSRDAAEARALERLLGQRAVPAGALLGAAGSYQTGTGLQVAQALLALGGGVLAGAPGFDEPDPDARVPGLQKHARPGAAQCALVWSPAAAAVFLS